MRTNYHELSTEELITEFISAELIVPIPLAKEICNRPDSVPHLARIIEEDKYWEVGGPGDGWSPFHALHLLGCNKTTEALHVLIVTLRNRGKDIGDWLTEDMPSILANFGSSAVEPLTELVLDESLDAFVRGAAATALGVIAHNHSEYREPVIKLFRQILKEANAKGAEENNYTFITLLVDDLAQLKDQDAFEDIEQAFANGLIDEFFINLNDIKRIYRTPDEDMPYHYHHEKDPMDQFSQKNIDYLYKLHYDTEKTRIEDKLKKSLKTLDYPQQVYGVWDDTDSKSKFSKGKRKEKKIGRNDPCPCGSGKKYKKCCLGKDTL
jgi:hypothetical protein